MLFEFVMVCGVCVIDWGLVFVIIEIISGLVVIGWLMGFFGKEEKCILDWMFGFGLCDICYVLLIF